MCDRNLEHYINIINLANSNKTIAKYTSILTNIYGGETLLHVCV
jgi:hypothetical protein